MTNFSEIEPVLLAGAKDNFVLFCYYYDYEFFKKRPFLKDIAIAFQKIEDKEINTLAVSLPPRSGKSYITTLFCAWTLGKHPTESVMRNTCTATLSRKLSYDTRAILKKQRFINVFPNVILAPDKSAIDGWNTNYSKSVGYFGQGVGGTIIGFGATKAAITDDLFRSMEDALSENTRDKVHSWKQATHDSRRESGCPNIDIGTRWCRDDIIGTNSRKGYYDLEIVVPALDINDNSFCEDVKTTDEFLKVRSELPKEIWSAEYQQLPIDIDGRLFENLRTFNDDELPSILERSEGALAYIDVADEGADYHAMAVGHIIGKDIYITDVVFTRDNTDITIPLCAEKLITNKVSHCRIETNSMGAMFLKSLRKLNLTSHIIGINNSTNKQTRILMNSAIVINRMLFKENPTKEYAYFMNNLANYSKEGKSKHDDAPDCITGLAMFFATKFSHLY